MSDGGGNSGCYGCLCVLVAIFSYNNQLAGSNSDKYV